MASATECRYYTDCRQRNDELWEMQKQRNIACDELFRRWGSWKDAITKELAACRADAAKSRHGFVQIEAALELMREQSRQYQDGTTRVLAELAESIRSWREAAEKNHADLMSAVVANAALATRAVDRADAAAARADAARKASSASAGRISTLTTATLAGWGAAVVAVGALAMHLVVDYGIPWFKSMVNRL